MRARAGGGDANRSVNRCRPSPRPAFSPASRTPGLPFLYPCPFAKSKTPDSMSVPLSPPIRVLIADDHPLMREGIAALLASQDGIAVVALAADGADAVLQFERHRPDLCLVDLQM